MKYYDAVEEYMDQCIRGRNLSKHTIKSYRNVLRKFGEWLEEAFGVDDIDDVSRDIVRKYVRKLNDELAPSSAKHHFIVTGSFFSYMEEIEELDESPFKKVRAKIKTPKRLPTTLTLEEVNKILVAAYTAQPGVANGSACAKMLYYRDCVVLEFLFNTGMRIQELCDLRTRNFDRKSGTIYVYGKGSRERKCYITQQAVFDVYDQYEKARRVFMKEMGVWHDFMFVNKFGMQMSAQAARLMIDKYVEIADIKKHVTPHVFRHTFASLLLEEGVGLKHIQEYLGHSTIATTQIYLHVSEENAKEVLRQNHPRGDISAESFRSDTDEDKVFK